MVEKPAGRGRRPDPSKRAAIVETASALFAAQGYGVSMETIATEAGVSKQTIYNVFSTKEHLFGAVVASCSQVIVETIADPDNDAPPATVLRALAREFLHLIGSGSVSLAYRMMITAMSGAGGATELTRHFYDNGPRRTLTQLAAYLARQHAKGRLRVDDPLLSAESFLGMLNGHMLIRNMLGLQETWAEDVLDAKAEHCVRAFLAAHAP